jgi:hypothetical protein
MKSRVAFFQGTWQTESSQDRVFGKLAPLKKIFCKITQAKQYLEI